MTITQIILFTVISGVAATAFGGFLGSLSGRNLQNLSRILAFASGIMLGVVCFDIIPSGFDMYTYADNKLWICIILTVIGMAVGMLSVFLCGKLTERTQECKGNKNRLSISGITIFFAILIHNLPEGMAIGSGNNDAALSISLILLIGLHNIPEGMSISAPLVMGGYTKTKSTLYSALSGVSTVIGGVIGWVLTEISYSFSALCMSVAGGAMLYVTFTNLLEEVYKEESKNKNIFIFAGIILSFVITYMLKNIF